MLRFLHFYSCSELFCPGHLYAHCPQKKSKALSLSTECRFESLSARWLRTGRKLTLDYMTLTCQPAASICAEAAGIYFRNKSLQKRAVCSRWQHPPSSAGIYNAFLNLIVQFHDAEGFGLCKPPLGKLQTLMQKVS